MVHAITGWILAIIGVRLHYVVSRQKMLLGYTMGMVVCLRSLLGQLLGMRKRVVRRRRLLPSPFTYAFETVFAFAFALRAADLPLGSPFQRHASQGCRRLSSSPLATLA